MKHSCICAHIFSSFAISLAIDVLAGFHPIGDLRPARAVSMEILAHHRVMQCSLLRSSIIMRLVRLYLHSVDVKWFNIADREEHVYVNINIAT